MLASCQVLLGADARACLGVEELGGLECQSWSARLATPCGCGIYSARALHSVRNRQQLGSSRPALTGLAADAAARAQVQCITHFLQLPIEDDLLADLEPGAPAGQPLAGDGAAAARAGDAPIPFADAGNPVMAQARSTSAWTAGACVVPAARIGRHPLVDLMRAT